MNSWRTDTLVDSDYNAYGYDPLGMIAHVCHLFFGPEWQPATQNQTLIICLSLPVIPATTFGFIDICIY